MLTKAGRAPKVSILAIGMHERINVVLDEQFVTETQELLMRQENEINTGANRSPSMELTSISINSIWMLRGAIATGALR